MPTTTIGKYRIVNQLGRGATGIVYRAVDTTLGREVALKILDPSLTDSAVLERFRAEATVLASLNHPGIATIYDLFRSEKDLLLVMELVRGETLEHLCDRVGPLPPDRASYLVDLILSALEHAHRAGVVHRDVKPANVMVTELGGIKIMDFGVARTRGAEQVPADGYLIGTPAYMPPEQILGETVDGRADLYSVGVIYYRLLAGALPFTANTSVDMFQQQISAVPPPLRRHRTDLPHWCQEIIDRALAKPARDRFASAGAFRDALAQAGGVVAAIDLAKEFSVGQQSAHPTSAPANQTLVMTRPGGHAADAVAQRAKQRKRNASVLIPFAACVASLVYVPVKYAPPEWVAEEPVPFSAASARFFDAKLLDRDGRERDAQLVLAEQKLFVTIRPDTRRPVYSVPYRRISSIRYSRSRDPLWSPPAPRQRPGAPNLWRVAVERHWIAVRTSTPAGVVVLRFDNEQIKDVRAALKDRTKGKAKG
jgi:tRNA A-37 threonylcarbamoyl transferase component Bud32